MWIIPSTCSGSRSLSSSTATSAWWSGGSAPPDSLAVKSLDTLDFPAIPSLNKVLVMELARCEYIQRRENVIAIGNSGTGKTHVALGLGLGRLPARTLCGFHHRRRSGA